MAELADQLKLSRMAAVEEWRSKSFALGGPLGNVLARSYDLINTVIRNGVTDEMTVGYALESLANERTLAMTRDVDRDDPIRHLVYGLTESLGTVLESIREGMQAPAPAAADHMDGPQQSGVSEHNDDGLPQFKEEEEAHEDGHDEAAALLIAKEEQLEQQDLSGRTEHDGQADVLAPATSSNLHGTQDDAIEPTATNDQDEDNRKGDEDEEMEEDDEEDEDEEEKVKDEEPCTSAKADRSRKRRRAYIDDEDEEDKDAYSGESDTERSMTTDSRRRPRRKNNDDKRRSSRLCATGPKIYVDPDDNGQVTLRRRPVSVKMDEDEEETEEVDDHSCGECDRKFDSARALSVHSRVHNVMEYPASSSGEDDDDFIDDRNEEGEEVEEPVPWRLRVRERVTKTNKFIR